MTARSYVGWWYASGPADREFSPDDPAFTILRVVSDTSEVPGAVTIQNAAGQRFPLERSLLRKIASPPDALKRRERR